MKTYLIHVTYEFFYATYFYKNDNWNNNKFGSINWEEDESVFKFEPRFKNIRPITSDKFILIEIFCARPGPLKSTYQFALW